MPIFQSRMPRHRAQSSFRLGRTAILTVAGGALAGLDRRPAPARHGWLLAHATHLPELPDPAAWLAGQIGRAHV